ncbi:MAG: hypothetical protein KJ645_10265, partial [Planctomycetes bacterium]|nr:hypothetical protein [Planctomycetota bacterium]
MGKTCIIKKMKEEAPEGCIAVFHDLERMGRPVEFVRGVLGDIEKHLARTKKISNQAGELRKKLSGVKLGVLQVSGVVDPHWKELLLATLGDLLAHKDCLVIFFWDEMPLIRRRWADAEYIKNLAEDKRYNINVGVLGKALDSETVEVNQRLVDAGAASLLTKRDNYEILEYWGPWDMSYEKDNKVVTQKAVPHWI